MTPCSFVRIYGIFHGVLVMAVNSDAIERIDGVGVFKQPLHSGRHGALKIYGTYRQQVERQRHEPFTRRKNDPVLTQ